MMTLWCLFGSPLMLGAELTKLDDETLSLLTNKQLLALLPPSYRPRQLRRDDTQAAWIIKNAEEDTCHVALFNLSEQTMELEVTQEELELKAPARTRLDLWTGQESPVASGRLCAVLEPHACVIWQVFIY